MARPADPLETEEGESRVAAARERNRAVAEREASRLARPEGRRVGRLGHAARTKSAVTSTPSGYHARADGDSEHHDEWCGPFSVARQMIAKREEARRKREAEQEGDGEAPHPLDAIMEEVEMEQKRKAHPSLQWKSKVPTSWSSQHQSYYAKRQKRVQALSNGAVPSLFQLCVNFLVENFDCVESLGDVDSSIRRAVCEELVAKKKMNGAAFDAITEIGMEALELVDCAEVTQDQLAQSLRELLPEGLKFLMLHHAGRCFGPKAVQSVIASPTSALFAISISGAYLLKDDDAASLICATGGTLASVEFNACPFLGSKFCKALSDSFSSAGKGNLIELSLEDLPVSKHDLLSLGSSSDALRNLKSLSLKQIAILDDEIVLSLLDAVQGTLESINFSYNHNLTDDALSGIRRCNRNGALRSLQLCGLKNLTEPGLEAFFTHDVPGLPSPPMLRTLNLCSCDYEAVTDEVLDLATRASSMKRNDGSRSGAVSGVLSSMGGLMFVNIHGSSCTDRTMESLAATSSSSLRELDVSFCSKISDKGLGYLVSKASNQLVKLYIWGCAQITDEFLDGHSRVGDNTFEVVGTWMKKGGGPSMH